jgi:tetratricopeptide (TPR) repeat protein
MDPIPRNFHKEKDYVARSRFIWILAWFLAIPFIVIIMVSLLGGDLRFIRWLAQGGIIILVSAAVLLAVIFFFAVGRFSGSYLNLLMPGGRSIRSRREQMAADFAGIKEDKRQGRFEEALQKMDAYLAKDPNYPEALFLKAQILMQGSGNAAEARRYLTRVRKAVPEKEPLHRWAEGLLAEIKKEEDRKEDADGWA